MYIHIHNLGDFSAECLSFVFRPFFFEVLNFDDEQLPQGWVCWTVSIRGGGVPVF